MINGDQRKAQLALPLEQGLGQFTNQWTIERGEWLIEQYQWRAPRQHPGHRDTAGLSTGDFPRRRRPYRIQS